jgi:hypothetical protein
LKSETVLAGMRDSALAWFWNHGNDHRIVDHLVRWRRICVRRDHRRYLPEEHDCCGTNEDEREQQADREPPPAPPGCQRSSVRTPGSLRRISSAPSAPSTKRWASSRRYRGRDRAERAQERATDLHHRELSTAPLA